MKKTTIAISGKAEQGKSATVVILRDLIKSRYIVKETVLKTGGDIKVIIEYKGIKIGIESQGDPNSRQPNSIKEFISKNCDIIIGTCRTSGETKNVMTDTSKHGYRVFWTRNLRSDIPSTHIKLNELSSQSLLELLDSILSGRL